MGRQRWYTKDLQTTQHAASTSHHVMSDAVRLLHEKLEHRSGSDFKRMDTRRTVELTPIQRRKRIDRAALGLDSKFANPTLEPLFETAGQDHEEKISALDVIPKEVDAELVGVLQRLHVEQEGFDKRKTREMHNRICEAVLKTEKSAVRAPCCLVIGMPRERVTSQSANRVSRTRMRPGVASQGEEVGIRCVGRVRP